MTNLKIFCISMNDEHLQKINEIGYYPVGLGSNNFSNGWIRDFVGENISEKNPFYGEYTFHYNLWKNKSMLNNYDEWVGFCTYRRFWSQTLELKKNFVLQDDVLKFVPKQWKKYETILVKPIAINETKLSKIIKHGKKILIKNPLIFFDKKKISIKVHFDMYHGYGNLDKAIDLIDSVDREKFRNYVITENSFNPYNMFICKNKKILIDYYSVIFPWLKRCEKIFGFDLGESYGKKRIYGFLAERFLSYWFNKYTNSINWPIYFKNII